MKSVFIALFAVIAGCASVQLALAADTVIWKESVLYSFLGGTDGGGPQASVINVNGTLYGTTTYGGGTGCGGSGCGTVFAVDRHADSETVVYSFGRRGEHPIGNLLDVNSTLYGATSFEATSGTIFALDLNTGKEKTLYNAIYQNGGLIEANGLLYGTTAAGGTYNGGTVFVLDPKTGAETALYSFCADCADGSNPDAGLIYVNGLLYGTTYWGGNPSCTFSGSSGCGVVFSVDPNTGAEKALYSFCSQANCSDGAHPDASLVAVNGLFYGTTQIGGANCQSIGGCGTVFSVDPSTGAETVVYSFCSQTNCADGENPQSALIYANGALYGTLSGGGSNGRGLTFALDPTTGAETVLYSFCSQQNCTDGSNPSASLIYVNGTLYGTTWRGGASGAGAVFALKKKR